MMRSFAALAFICLIAVPSTSALELRLGADAQGVSILEGGNQGVNVLTGGNRIAIEFASATWETWTFYTPVVDDGSVVIYDVWAPPEKEVIAQLDLGSIRASSSSEGFALWAAGNAKTTSQQGRLDAIVQPGEPPHDASSKEWPSGIHLVAPPSDQQGPVYLANQVNSVVVSNVSLLFLSGVGGRITSEGGTHEFQNGVERIHASPDHAVEKHRFDVFKMSDAEMEIQGQHDAAMISGPTLDWSIEGLAILPLVRPSEAEAEWKEISPGTWAVDGSFRLGNVQVTDRRTVNASMTGEIKSLSVDGQAARIPPMLSSMAATAATGAAGFLIWKILAATLFTRLSPEKALEHPNRQRLYGYIQEHPGTTFREILRETGIPAGTTRHHLSVLQRSKVIVEHSHGATLRFFENHGRYDMTWDAVVMLREPELAQAHAWFMDHPGAIQREFLEASEGWGWSRSTAQHRVRRLVNGGLLTIVRQGRRNVYTAHETTQTNRAKDPPWMAKPMQAATFDPSFS